ncbi:MAG: MgtC/SapB family protein [Lentisphaerae bacterium]|nr:MgtC/SapB family protein [Lentisphaerota bacterium]
METICIVRLLLAGLLGGLIGAERELRSKDAGLRTHFLVAIGATLFMLVSQFGLIEALNGLTEMHPGINLRVDISRVSTQIVSGIGFIGAGTIVLHKRFVMGLTTAAGIWTTAAIGMAVGGGLYLAAVATTLFVLVGLEILIILSRVIGYQKKEMHAVFTAADEAVRDIALDGLRAQGKTITSYSTESYQNLKLVEIDFDVPEHEAKADKILCFLNSIEGIKARSVK